MWKQTLNKFTLLVHFMILKKKSILSFMVFCFKISNRPLTARIKVTRVLKLPAFGLLSNSDGLWFSGAKNDPLSKFVLLVSLHAAERVKQVSFIFLIVRNHSDVLVSQWIKQPKWYFFSKIGVVCLEQDKF